MARFKPGESGNSAGRPKGSGRAAQLRALLEPHAAALVKKAVELAKKGDTTALRLCLERLVPAMKPETRLVEIPGLAEATTLADQGRAVLASVAAGTITAEQSATLLQAISVQSAILKNEEFERRIERLEKSKKP